jgi:Sigma-70, region 4
MLGAAAVGMLVAGIVVRNSAVGITLIGLAAALLFAAVVMPGVGRVEYGFPSGLKISADLQSREDALRREFEAQRADLELCAKLLCDDPATATDLLAAAMARAVAGWRGPVHPDIRVYVLCWFVQTLMARSRLSWTRPAAPAADAEALCQLPQVQRIVVVLSEFAELPIDDIADMVRLSAAQAQAELANARAALAQALADGGAAR